jgi:hypothetical protein
VKKLARSMYHIQLPLQLLSACSPSARRVASCPPVEKTEAKWRGARRRRGRSTIPEFPVRAVNLDGHELGVCRLHLRER